MKLENQVVSLEMAKKLKELEVKHDSYFGWVRDPMITKDYFVTCDSDEYDWHYPAYTVAELGEMLPFSIEAVGEHYYLTIDKARDYWHINYEDVDGIALFKKYEMFSESTEANARAKMLIYLLKNKLVEL